MRPVHNALLVITLLALTAAAFAQAPQRYRDEIFPEYQVQSNIQYGQVLTKILTLDVYTGSGDTLKKRPLIIFIHAGGFETGEKSTPFAVLVCGHVARRGYVAASINYRLTTPISGDTAYFEAMLRALHDAKAAVRFFRKNGSMYGVDTSQIFAVGSSAGAITALHLAYLDSAEVPRYVDWTRVDGTFEGSSGNPGFSSHVQAVISNWGAIGDTAWIPKGGIPVYCVHGTSDSTIYYNLIPAYGPFLYSSRYIIEAAQQKGLTNGLRLFYRAGHELNNDTTKQDSAIHDFCAWLYTLLKPGTTSVREATTSLPTSPSLLQNYPNPFNPSTTITFSLPARMAVMLEVFDVLGRRTGVLANGIEDAGRHDISFSASNLASGIYFFRLTAGGTVTTRKMVLAK